MSENRASVKRLAVIGHPVSHSRSPAMQNAALAELGLGEEWTYEAIDVAPDGFEDLIGSMAGSGFVGANVTVPHKEAACLLADSSGAEAASIGAANTLIFGPDGVRAENTDAPGLIAAIGDLAPVRALVLGAGGAGRAAAWALARAGHRVEVWNRTDDRARSVASEMGVSSVRAPETTDYGLIVNSTSVGLGGEGGLDQLPLEPERFTGAQVFVDMVYGDHPSELLAAATGAGARTIDGIEVLVRQGALSLRLWTGLEPSLEVMRSAARA